jgi:hypothetical protein
MLSSVKNNMKSEQQQNGQQVGALSDWNQYVVNQETRRKEEWSLHVHMKNRKKYTHLYQLEKYFK